MSQIPFLVETGRVLEILSKQIYDSPYAMVRENVQNAYDAVLMRASVEQRAPSEFAIRIVATPTRVDITDNGIGMSEDVLRNNFWRAGSSGKNNDAARAAGVIGTFGIGAMANFGVADRLRVDTRPLGTTVGFRTVAEKARLTIGGDCIEFETVDEGIDEGTRIVADIAPSSPLDVEALRNYLAPFVRLLAVGVELNGTVLSQGDPRLAAGLTTAWRPLATRELHIGRLSFDAVVLSDGTNVGVVVDGLVVKGERTSGGMWLRQQGGQILGLRSRFGLATLPFAGVYQLGGFVDLPFLVPTAGREALTRESIQEASQLVTALECTITEVVKDTELADVSGPFQQHLLQLGQTAWGGRVKVQLSPGDDREELHQLAARYAGEKPLWYAGVDPDIVATFSSQDRPLLRVSQNKPRREVQIRYLRDILHLEPVPDTASVQETFASSELSWNEVSLMLSIVRVLRSDYLIDDVQVDWVRISHGVTMLAELVGNRVVLRMARNWSAVQAVIKAIEGSPELLDGLTKDLVRVHVYDRIKSFVPSSQRSGLDALQRTLAKRRELYRLDADDRGDLEPLLADYLAGKTDFQTVLSAAARAAAGQTQRVGKESVGRVEDVLNDVVNGPVRPEAVPSISAPEPGSPILRLDTVVDERLLTTARPLAALNNHQVFLALSDRVFQLEREFFMWPHSTQVAWAGKRIVFLFGMAQSGQSLYYDVELRANRAAGDAGGTALLTTTIVTQNRIFVPVPGQLAECFTVTDGPVEFYVRFDLLGHR